MPRTGLAVARDADGDHRRLAHHPAVEPHLVVRRIDPDVRVVRRERPRPKRLHERIELAADARDLGLRDAVQAERLHQLVDLPRRDAVDVRFLDHRQQRVFGPPARLQQRREIGAGPHFRNRQLDRAHPCVPRPHPVAIPVARPVGRALVPVGTDQTGHFRFHERLGEHPDALPQDIAILLLEQLANERRQIHSGLRHRVNISVSSFAGQERTHGKMRDGGSPCLRRRPYRISTTFGDSNPALAGRCDQQPCGRLAESKAETADWDLAAGPLPSSAARLDLT
jgi:hypothetical protein